MFIGESIGANGSISAEVVFNTSMTGYQEILTDPSYCRQIVTLTYPHIGNCGVNEEDVESDTVQAAGLVIKDLPRVASNFRSSANLSDYLQKQGTVAIAGIDTRQLTRLLRSKGAQNGCITALAPGQILDESIKAQAVASARAAPAMSGLDLAQVVTTGKAYGWDQTEWSLQGGYGIASEAKWHVVAYDFGIKKNILRMLASRNCRITVVPAKTNAKEVLALRPDGLFLSNGPGDPAPCTYAIEAVRQILAPEHSQRFVEGDPTALADRQAQ